MGGNVGNVRQGPPAFNRSEVAVGSGCQFAAESSEAPQRMPLQGLIF